MCKLYPLLLSTPRVRHHSPRNRNKRRKNARAMHATHDLTNCSTSAEAISKTCFRDLPTDTPPITITYKPPGPSFSFTSKGKKKKQSIDLQEQFKRKPPVRKTKKANPPADPNAIASRTRSKQRPVSSRTRSKEPNVPTNSTRKVAAPKRSASLLNKREELIELDIQVEIIEERIVAAPSETESSLDEIDQVTHERRKSFNDSVEGWAEHFRNTRLKDEADRREKDRQRQKEKEEQDRLRQKEKEEQDKKAKEQKDQWAKIFAKKRNQKGGKRKLKNDKLDEMNELKQLEWASKMEKMDAEYEKGRKEHFEQMTKEERHHYGPLTFTYDEHGNKIPKKIKKKKTKKKKQTVSFNFIKGWIFYTILFCWCIWRYRTKIGLCLLLWHCYVGYLELKKSM